MYNDKTLICKDCGNDFSSLRASRNSTPKKDSPTSRSAASPAAMPEKEMRAAAIPSARCLRRSAPSAEKPAGSPSSRAATALFIAVSASRIEGNQSLLSVSLRGHTFFSVPALFPARVHRPFTVFSRIVAGFSIPAPQTARILKAIRWNPFSERSRYESFFDTDIPHAGLPVRR